MTVFLVLFLSIVAFAQQFQYRLEGSFPTKAAPESPSPTTVNYTINWNETSSGIQGLYQDNYFAQGGPRIVTGGVSDESKTFNVILPTPIFGASELVFKTTQTEAVTGTIPMQIQSNNRIGVVIDNYSSSASMVVQPGETGGGPTNDDDESCVVGFGSLTKFCGLYNGNFHEIDDPQNRCDIAGRNPRMELSSDTVFRMILDYTPGAQNLPTQNIGAFVPTPVSNTIAIGRVDCGIIPGTTFAPGACRNLSLNGSFWELGGDVQFTGTYSISDNNTGEQCAYSLYLRRDVIY